MQIFQYIIKGKVQGVAFRYYTKKEADRLGILGYVRNLNNGNVEVVAAGKKNSLETFEFFLNVGPSSARVESIEKNNSEKEVIFSSFEIIN